MMRNRCQKPALIFRRVSSRTLPHNSGFGTRELPESSWLATDMSTISRSARLSKSPDGGVVLDVDRGVIFSLNSVGARIVELLQQGKDAMSVGEAIRREFQVSEEIATKDVADFFVTLREQHLLSDSSVDNRSIDGAL
jgi:hypothetical protein